MQKYILNYAIQNTYFVLYCRCIVQNTINCTSHCTF